MSAWWWDTAKDAAASGWTQLQSAAANAAEIAAAKLGDLKEHAAHAAEVLDQKLGLQENAEAKSSVYQDNPSSCSQLASTGQTLTSPQDPEKKKRAEEIAKTPAPWDFVAATSLYQTTELDPSEDPSIVEAVTQTLSHRLEVEIRALAGDGEHVSTSFIATLKTNPIDETQGVHVMTPPSDFKIEDFEFFAAKALRSDIKLAALYYMCVSPGGLRVRHVRPNNYESLAAVLQSSVAETFPEDLTNSQDLPSSAAQSQCVKFTYRSISENAFWYHYFTAVNAIRQHHGVLPLIDLGEASPQPRSISAETTADSSGCALGQGMSQATLDPDAEQALLDLSSKDLLKGFARTDQTQTTSEATASFHESRVTSDVLTHLSSSNKQPSQSMPSSQPTTSTDLLLEELDSLLANPTTTCEQPRSETLPRSTDSKTSTLSDISALDKELDDLLQGVFK